MIQDKIIEAAKAVIARWDSPDWKDATHTRDYIYALRDAVNESELAAQLFYLHQSKPQPTSQDVLDAERYRWLRKSDFDIFGSPHAIDLEGNSLDKAIDAAMKESKQ